MLLSLLKKTVFFAIVLSLQVFDLSGQEIASAVGIEDVAFRVEDDSLRVRFNIKVDSLDIGRVESLSLLPEITDGRVAVPLPAVVFSGSLRRKYDVRKQAFAPETRMYDSRIYDIRKNKTYTVVYEAAVPWSSRLQSGKMVVEYRYDDCCRSIRLKEKRFAIQLPEREATPQPQPQPQTVIVRDTVIIRDTVVVRDTALFIRRTETLHLEYPVNQHGVYPEFENNRTHLERLDTLFQDGFRGKIRLTAYTSPEGPYGNNEFLARNRAESFREYLVKHYGIPVQDITTGYVVEDWEGMRALVVDNDFTGKAEALDIIDGTDIWDGREKQLMELHDGAFWKEFLPYFRQLRRIEVEILRKD